MGIAYKWQIDLLEFSKTHHPCWNSDAQLLDLYNIMCRLLLIQTSSPSCDKDVLFTSISFYNVPETAPLGQIINGALFPFTPSTRNSRGGRLIGGKTQRPCCMHGPKSQALTRWENIQYWNYRWSLSRVGYLAADVAVSHWNITICVEQTVLSWTRSTRRLLTTSNE